MKKIAKAIGLIVALLVAFAAGLVWTSTREFWSGLAGPRIESDYVVRGRIEELLPGLPDSAHHLYHAMRGFQDPDIFIACSVPADEVDALLDQVYEMAKCHVKKTPNADQDVLARGPDSWGDSTDDRSWDLSTCSDIVVLSRNGVTILHSPAKHRVFVCLPTY